MRSNNHAIPRGQRHVVAIRQAVTDAAISHPLLALLQLLEEHEIARDWQ